MTALMTAATLPLAVKLRDSALYRIDGHPGIWRIVYDGSGGQLQAIVSCGRRTWFNYDAQATEEIKDALGLDELPLREEWTICDRCGEPALGGGIVIDHGGTVCLVCAGLASHDNLLSIFGLGTKIRDLV
jgi:hypothetical protein